MGTRLELRDLTVELPTPTGWVRPVDSVSFALGEGEALAVVGESGSGKTMLALALMGLLPPGARAAGDARLQDASANGNGPAGHAHITPAPSASLSDSPRHASGKNLLTASPAEMRALRGRRIAMIFQEPMTALNPMMRAGAQIAEAIRAHERGLAAEEVRRRVLRALERAAVPEPERRARQYPHELSGGLRQRVMIAMALAAGPGLLIADEPTTALDVTAQKQILDLLETLRRELRLSLLFITHDLGVAARVAERVGVMYAGRIVEEGAATDVFRRPAHPYTTGLLRAAPGLGRNKLESIPGTVPPLNALPPGCAFAPRCALHAAACDTAVPELISVREDDGHRARCILAGGKA